MGVANKLVRGLLKSSWTRFMDRVGGRFVSGIADTSADAPSTGYAPKRDLYRKMQEQRMAQAGQEQPASSQDSAEAAGSADAAEGPAEPGEGQAEPGQ